MGAVQGEQSQERMARGTLRRPREEGEVGCTKGLQFDCR